MNNIESKSSILKFDLKLLLDIGENKIDDYCKTLLFYMMNYRISVFEDYSYLFLTKESKFDFTYFNKILFVLISYFGGIERGEFADKIIRNKNTNELGFNIPALNDEIAFIKDKGCNIYDIMKNRNKYPNFYFFCESILFMDAKLYSEKYSDFARVISQFWEQETLKRNKSQKHLLQSQVESLFRINFNQLVGRKCIVIDLRTGEKLLGSLK